MPTEPSHPSDVQLMAVAEANLSGRALDRLIEHIDGCRRCQSRIEVLAEQRCLQAPTLASLRGRSLPRTNAPDHGHSDHVAGSHAFDHGAAGDRAVLGSGSSRKRFFGRKSKPAGDRHLPSSPFQGDLPSQMGAYQILHRIGSGGMGVVYRARHVHLGRDVAIKWLAESVTDRATAQRVIGEWRAHGALSHPGIVSAIDAGVHEGLPYLVTEFIQGADFSRIVSAGGPLTVTEALVVLHQIADALRYAHGRSAAHLDIKPSNVMLDNNGKVHLLDLGTAHITQSVVDGDSTRSAIMPNAVLGTLAYLAPERIGLLESVDAKAEVGAAAEVSDESVSDPRQADLYSLGCTLHFLLTGKPPFPINTQQPLLLQSKSILHQHLHSSTRRLVQLRTELAEFPIIDQVQSLVDSMMHKNPQDRFTINEVIEALEAFKTNQNLAELPSHHQLVTLLDGVSGNLEPTDHGRSGQTLHPTDLVSTSTDTQSPKRWWWLIGLLIVGGIVLGIWSAPTQRAEPITPAALQDTAPAPTPLASDSPSLAATWLAPAPIVGNGFPEKEPPVGIAIGSTKSMSSIRESDPSIVSASICTVSPSATPLHLRWSADGNHLAVLTLDSQIRLYRWHNQRLQLQNIFGYGTRRSDRAQAMCWDPIDGSLVVFGDDHLLSFTPTDDGAFRCHQVPWPTAARPDTSPQHAWCLRDGDRAIYLLSTAKDLFIYDSLSQRRFPFDRGSDSNVPVDVLPTATADGNKLFYRTSNSIECVKPRFVSSGKQSEWQWDQLASLTMPAGASSFHTIGISADGEVVAAQQNDQVTLYRMSNGDMLGKNPAISGFLPNHLSVIASPNQSQMTVLLKTRTRLRMRCVDPTLHSELRFQRALIDEQGARYEHALFTAHPLQNLFAVALPGRMEIWGNNAQLVTTTPSVAPVTTLQALQTRPGYLLLRPDGAGIAIDTDGRFISRPFPPADHKITGHRFLEQQELVEPDMDLWQQGERDFPTSQRRLLIPWGIPAQSATEVTIGLIPKRMGSGVRTTELVIEAPPADGRADQSRIHRAPCPIVSVHRIAVAREARMVLMLRSKGDLTRFDLDGEIPLAQSLAEPFHRIQGHHRIGSITVDANAKTLYFMAEDESRRSLHALDLQTMQQRWQQTDPELAEDTAVSGIFLRAAPNADTTEQQQLFCPGKHRWLVLDRHSGEILTKIDPHSLSGTQQHHCVMANDQSVASTGPASWISPVTLWTSDFGISNRLFCNQQNQWIHLNAEGEIIDLTSLPTDTLQTRRVLLATGKQEKLGELNAPDDSANNRIAEIIESFCIRSVHADNRITIQPFRSLLPTSDP